MVSAISVGGGNGGGSVCGVGMEFPPNGDQEGHGANGNGNIVQGNGAEQYQHRGTKR